MKSKYILTVFYSIFKKVHFSFDFRNLHFFLLFISTTGKTSRKRYRTPATSSAGGGRKLSAAVTSMSEPLKLKLKLSPVTQGIEDEADDEQGQPLRKKKKTTKQKYLVTAIDEAESQPGTDPVAAKSHAKLKNPRQRGSKDDLGLDADGVPNQHPLDSSTELCHHCNLGKL